MRMIASSLPTFASALILALIMTLSLPVTPAHATEIDDFSKNPAARWAFFADTVMGGVSTGQASFPDAALRLTGTVSTENNGGFIQARLKLPERMPKDATALVLRVRGNGAGYFVHLRTGATILPWQYYQAAFPTSGSWSEIRLPFTAFAPSTKLLRQTPDPASVRSVAIVAFGADYEADVWVDWIGWE